MIAGPADGSNGELACWTANRYETPLRKRVLMVHAQDAGYKAVAAHAEASGLRHWKLKDGLPGQIGGLALIDEERMPALSAHGCLAGPLSWGTNTKRQELFKRLLERVFNQWQDSQN